MNNIVVTLPPTHCVNDILYEMSLCVLCIGVQWENVTST